MDDMELQFLTLRVYAYSLYNSKVYLCLSVHNSILQNINLAYHSAQSKLKNA